MPVAPALVSLLCFVTVSSCANPGAVACTGNPDSLSQPVPPSSGPAPLWRRLHSQAAGTGSSAALSNTSHSSHAGSAGALKPYLAASVRKDGFGTQLLCRLTCLAQARAGGGKQVYLHIPFSQVNLANGYEQALEEAANLGYEEAQAAQVPVDRIEDRRHCLALTDSRPHLLAALAPALRAKFHVNKGAAAIAGVWRWAGFRAGAVNVAVHVRRNDVHYVPERFLGMDFYTAATTGVEAGLRVGGLQHINFQVFTDGSKDEVTGLAANASAGVHLAFEGSPALTWQALVEADVLVTARSSFSHTAAIYSSGVVVYSAPYRHAKLPGWLEFTGSSDALASEVQQLIGRLHTRLAQRHARLPP